MQLPACRKSETIREAAHWHSRHSLKEHHIYLFIKLIVVFDHLAPLRQKVSKHNNQRTSWIVGCLLNEF
jgi:hypothetical protein